eukprot:scaffold64266_cov48-Prasinocladus_malaysianus.AAC.1
MKISTTTNRSSSRNNPISEYTYASLPIATTNKARKSALNAQSKAAEKDSSISAISSNCHIIHQVPNVALNTVSAMALRSHA